MKKILKLADKPEILLLLPGMLLIAASAINGLPPNYPITSPILRTIVLVLGILLTIASVILIISKNRSFWEQDKVSLDDCSLTIDFVEIDRSTHKIHVEGSVKNLPPDDDHIQIILFDQLTRLYWLKGKILCNLDKKTWKVTISIDTVAYGQWEIMLARIGPNGIQLFKEHNQWTQQTGVYRGIEQLPSDVFILARKEIPGNFRYDPISVS
jgi:hypothetical protein